MNIPTKIEKTILSLKLNVLHSDPFERIFLTQVYEIYRLPDKIIVQIQKILKWQNFSIEMSRTSVAFKFLFLKTFILLQNVAKDGELMATDVLYGPLLL